MMKSILAAAALLSIAGAANAEGEFETVFTFDPTAPVEITYDALQTHAKRACRTDYRRAGTLRAKMKIEKACQESLIEDAVRAIGNVSLIALHTGEPVSSQTIIVADTQ